MASAMLEPSRDVCDRIGCDEAVDRDAAKLPGFYMDRPELGPVITSDGSLYCTLGCASEGQGWR